MIIILAESSDKTEKDVELQYIQSAINTDLGKLKYLKDRLKKILKFL